MRSLPYVTLYLHRDFTGIREYLLHAAICGLRFCGLIPSPPQAHSRLP